MDVVIMLDHLHDFKPELSAVFTVEFAKSHHLSCDDARRKAAAGAAACVVTLGVEQSYEQ